ncbi:TIGR03546 family protein [Allofrancisella guangzhouensis]|uniref:Membrane protein n=1 Tax=Allofrancisella guangzhouensis TaxID=594679 RepID=A0A0A8E5Q7_9GAMM|nr:TIGR03546 family protein [Allofrancisella guangzhouensis]AJC49540.1 membrane protein [Allofrancisella guangzhouensis]MBK2027362.1 TIGR03546 family protein [Allofrancisella guangzhouensis]MBK2043453.1 TIGR03546 family protein [Allofrancisella guangzhouensis]MBK2045222.1 TIGR03546 family protein [Allofrancisella guangzhouensis]
MFVKVIFSPSTPVQLLLVLVFGFVFGFIPGFSYAPFLFLLIIFLVLVLRVNIGLFVITAILAKILSYILESISFTVGVWLLDGFTQPVFKTIINTPVLAYLGFDYYLVTGAFFVSLLLGIAFGLVIAKVYKKIVTKMANMQFQSQMYQKITSKLSVKIASKIVFGKNIAKVDWQKIQARKFRQPIRVWGTVLVVLFITGIVFAPQVLETALVSNIIKQQLTKANGATVDYDSISLNIAGANLQINGLGAADPANLNKDRFYAASISASLDVSKLLTKQISLKNVEVIDVSLDKTRDKKGSLYDSIKSQNIIHPEKNSQEIVKSVKKVSTSMQQIDVQEITKKAKSAKNVAKGIKQVVEFFSYFRSNMQSQDSITKITLAEINQQAKAYGYAGVKARHLHDKTPDFTIQNMIIKGYENEGVFYDIKVSNLSTTPILLAKPTEINVKSSNNDKMTASVVISNQVGVDNIVSFDLKNLTGEFAKGLSIQGVEIDADNLDITGSGKWQFKDVGNISFDVPLKLNFTKVTVSLKQNKQTIPNLSLDAVISGNLDKVNFAADTSSLTSLLSTEVVKKTAENLAKKAGLDKKTKDLLNKTTINGKSLNDLKPEDVKQLASQFGVSLS